MAELVDASALGAGVFGRGGSNPPSRTLEGQVKSSSACPSGDFANGLLTGLHLDHVPWRLTETHRKCYGERRESAQPEGVRR